MENRTIDNQAVINFFTAKIIYLLLVFSGEIWVYFINQGQPPLGGFPYESKSQQHATAKKLLG